SRPPERAAPPPQWTHPQPMSPTLGERGPASPGPRESGAEDDDDVLRRALLRMIASAAAPVDGQFVGAVERIRGRMDAVVVGGTVSPPILDRWEEAAAGYGRQYMIVPPLRLLCDVLLDFGDVRRMCEHRQLLEFSERLCRLAAQLAGLGGMIMIDVGHPGLGRVFFPTPPAAGRQDRGRHAPRRVGGGG